MFITEPAIGEGLGVTLAYFHPVKDQPVDEDEFDYSNPNAIRDASIGRKAPPTITGVFAGATNNDTKAFGGAHIDSFRNDTIRMVAGAGYLDLFATFYLLDQPLEFNLEGNVLFGDVKFRVNDSPFFWGLGLERLDAENRFRVELHPDFPEFDLPTLDFEDVGLRALAMFETRDDNLFPSSGQLIELKLSLHDQSIGGDFDYERFKFKLLSFHPLGEDWTIGWRLQFSAVAGAPPFFAVPWITLRGIPAMRYQGDEVAVTEIEARWRFADRWAAVAFGGLGWTDGDILGFDTSENVGAYGGGLRYMILREQNAWLGVDLAQGDEDTAWYVQLGHPW
jgi:hypothetical protein